MIPPRLPAPYTDEAAAARTALGRVERALDWGEVACKAGQWIRQVRRRPAPFWALENLLAEYPLSSAEGRALMRLAEALLRIADRDTAIALTADQLGRAGFDARSGDALAALTRRALALARAMLPKEEPPQHGLLDRLGAEAVVAIAVRAVQLLGRQFVLGNTMEEALARADDWRASHPGYRFSFDMLGEGARTQASASSYCDHYARAIEVLAARSAPGDAPAARDGVSVKLSALFPRYEELQHARVMAELVPRAWQLCDQAARAGIGLTLDAEETDRLELSLDVFDALLAQVRGQHHGWQGLGIAIQTYQTRALACADEVIRLAHRHRVRVMVRLVKGAYWDAEIKRAQVLGAPGYPVYTHKSHTDLNYLACARTLITSTDAVYPQFGSHNAATIAAVISLARDANAAFELQRLHGMGEKLYDAVLEAERIPCRVYAPVGPYRELLAYLVRRLLENGATSSFVHQLADEAVSIAALVRSPLQVEKQPALALPPALYGPQRANSRGLDLSVRADRALLSAAYADTTLTRPSELATASTAAVMEGLHDAFGAWSLRPVAERSDMLLEAADRMEARLPRFAACIVAEAHKTWDDAVAEVREAVDFLRYYAIEAAHLMVPLTLPGPTGETNQLTLRGRGAWVAISPWNFPLAIFTGQVAAALVTGNTVAAKPAEQTPAIAAAAVELLHECGVPREVLALCAGSGGTVGAALVAHPRVAGVVFTGSTAVARGIAGNLLSASGRRALAPLIAETGGINAMIVDPSALPEQVVDDVITSAFRSAGQRCSALRMLCLHEAIADEVIDMLQGAMRELTVGDPSDPATDVGPVIDAAAKDGLERQIAKVDARARLIVRIPVPARTAPFHHVAPCLYETNAVEDLDEEIFGPVLQVVRWRGSLEALVERINALGYGLTLGVHTRIEGRAERIAARARIGNVYVNRSIVGAVVGSQPFGGEGLSGTGPKAGGPH